MSKSAPIHRSPAVVVSSQALAVALTVLLAACSRTEPAPEPVRAVRTQVVAMDSAGGQREFAAEVRARVESRPGFRVAGKLVSRVAEVGQHVAAGQVLARVDGTDLKLGQDTAQAALRAAQTNYELAGAEFKRYKELRDQGFIGQLDLERRETTLKAQKAQLDQAAAQVSVQSNQAGYATLTAPAAGVITAVEAEAGAVLSAGTPVFRIAQDGPRDAVFAVPEDGAAGMRMLLGKAGAIRIRPWGATEALPATIREVAAAADPTTRTFQIKADVGAAKLQLGQTVTVLVDQPRREGVAKLPLAAVVQQKGQAAVWLLDRGSMTVNIQPVAVAGADGNWVVIGGGLTAGQTVVTAGVHTLTPGQKVKLYDGSLDGPASSQGSLGAQPMAPAPAPALAASR
jgi:RND family efflux transporter MFP subunit